MQLTPAQKTVLKANLAANVNTVLINGVATPINQITIGSALDTPDNWFAVETWYNLLASPAYWGWNNSVDVQAIYNAISFSLLTPADAVPTDTALNTGIWTCRSLSCQGKQFNLEIILQGRSSLDANQINIRAGLQDALTHVPSGASGAQKDAGWNPNGGGVLQILSRQGTNIEKVFATGAGTNDTGASTFAQTGTIDFTTIRDAAVSG
jgi:hypothetical protein